MNNVLIDSSAWIEYFRGNKAYQFIKMLIYNNMTCTNDLILTELLPSIRHKKEKHLEELLNSITKYEVKINWQELQDFQLLNFKHGYNNIGVTDLIIMQNCLQNNLNIIAEDKHFKEMAEYLPLKMFTKNNIFDDK
ncbi:twitching motility protein PilT [Spirochaetia bacterium]|nr:twitching motility protein PilT [Spirochaetia bacterium]